MMRLPKVRLLWRDDAIALRNFYDVEHAFCKVLADNGQDFFLDRAGFNIKLPNNRQFG